MFGMKDTAPCPYCYTSISPARLHFRCTGRPAPGRNACTKRQDDFRVRVLADSTPVLPAFQPEAKPRLLGSASAACPDCGGDTGTRVCPECHSVLPANFTHKSPLFGIVGVRGSGKTVMLTVLNHELTTSVARRFSANIDAVGSSNLLTRLDTGWRTLQEPGGGLPGQTDTYNATDTVPAVFEWQLELPAVGGFTRMVSTTFSFYDTSGEDLSTAERTREQHYLAAANGLILLLDPFGFPENREQALRKGIDPESLRDSPRQVLHNLTDLLRETERLRANKKIKRPLAVVLAKIDAFFPEVDEQDPIRRPSSREPHFDDAESLSLHHHVESLVAQWGGSDVLTMLRLNYTTYRFFVASALGAEPDYRAGRVNSRGVLPHRVAEPLLWLMAERGFLETRR